MSQIANSWLPSRQTSANLLLLRLATSLELAATTERSPEEQAEWERCAADPMYFVLRYVWIYNATAKRWLKFDLWPAQGEVLAQLPHHKRVVILKARQLGITWLVLAYALWLLIFHPIATVLLFSRRDDEAIELIKRLKGMHAKLPAWMQSELAVSNDHTLKFANESEAKGFPTTGGDSYTATLAIVDEADLIPDLARLHGAVGPTIDAGGQLVFLSRVNKSTPGSEFQRIYADAKAGKNEWHPIFLPWSARPERTQEWYEARRADSLSLDGTEDQLHEQYPATDAEALSPKSKDKRIAGKWLLQCYEPRDVIADAGGSLAGLSELEIYVKPRPGRSYVIGADPAEGNPSSDESSATVLDADTGEECSVLSGLFEPAVFGGHIKTLSEIYNGAPALVERNNHGHAVLLWLKDNASRVRRLEGLDGRPGWVSSTLGKVQLYNDAADAFRQLQTVLHSMGTYLQLASIEGRTLRAPQGENDDRADSYALAIVGRARALMKQELSGESRNHSAALKARLGGA